MRGREWRGKFRAEPLESLRRDAVSRGHLDHAPFDHEHRAAQGPAYPDGTPGDRLEHRLRVGRRGADHPQDLGRRCLPVKRLSEIGVACFQLLEQADVLDRDDGLVGERLQQRDLLVGEPPGLPSCDGDSTDRRPVAQHRHRHHAPRADRHGYAPASARPLDVCFSILGEGDAGVEHGAARSVRPARRHRVHRLVGCPCLRIEVVVCDEMDDIALQPIHDPKNATAESHGAVSDGIKDWL